MQFSQEILPGTWLVRLKQFEDIRGTFVKTYSGTLFEQHGAQMDLKEEFYSVSHSDVVRGMHFQLPPHDHVKLVYCPMGVVNDVLLDLRAGLGYGKVASVRLSADEPSLVFIPKGIAHGFRSLTDQSLMVYKTSTEYVPIADCGIRWDSFNYDWSCNAPVMSERDRQHPTLADFVTPF